MPDVRLIDLDLLKGKVEAMQACEPHYAYNFLNDALNPSTEWECIEDMIDSIPVIDAQPMKQGHWIRKAIFYVCSECGIKLIDDNFEQIAIFPNGYMKFCPNCNAKMEGVKNGNQV